MHTLDSPRVRTRRLALPVSPVIVLPAREIDLVGGATIRYSSESPLHPIDHLFDGRSGRGATRWASGRPDSAEEIVIELDSPQCVRRLILDVEEIYAERTQQMRLEYSPDGGCSYRPGLVCEYAFSPLGSTYRREDLGLHLCAVTHVRILVMPNKRGAGTASLTSLRLFS